MFPGHLPQWHVWNWKLEGLKHGIFEYPLQGPRLFAAQNLRKLRRFEERTIPRVDQMISVSREDAAFLDGGWDWVDGRQTEFYLIR